MDGMAMMLKSFGIDPEQIKGSLTTARDEIMSQVKALRDSQDRIEQKLLLIETNTKLQNEIRDSQKRIEETMARIDMYFQSHAEVQGAIEGVSLLPPNVPANSIPQIPAELRGQ
jgi:hypothetical protein